MSYTKDAFNWLIAAVLAIIITWSFLMYHSRESDANCAKNPCHLDYERRLSAIEAAMVARTQDRYTGADAKRDLALINQRIDSLQRQQQESRK
jgi:hypothetical protein